MDINNLTEGEKASLAKADAANVVVEARDNDGNLIENPVIPASAAPKVKPAGLPDKFWNAATGEADYASLAKSYTELEKARGSKPTATPPVVEPAAAAVTPEAKAAADAAALAAAKAADPAAAAAAAAAPAVTLTPQAAIDAANAEWAASGALTDATYETLAKTGINRGMVDMYIAGQQATQAAATAEAYEITGGQEGYTAMAAWAKANMSAPELAEFNANVTASRSIAKLAVAALHSKYVAANGTDGRLASGQNVAPKAGAGYSTQSEMTAAIRDPRYRSDATYRAQVERMIGLTSDDIV